VYDPFYSKKDNGLLSHSHRRRQLIMPKISGHGHVLILTDGAYVDGRMDLQKRETVKGCTGGGLVTKPSMLKSNHCNLSSNVYNMNTEVRKRECILIREVLCFI
jgi:hypothetical protein